MKHLPLAVPLDGAYLAACECGWTGHTHPYTALPLRPAARTGALIDAYRHEQNAHTERNRTL